MRRDTIQSVNLIHEANAGTKYKVHMESGRTHELAVYERGGTTKPLFYFEIDGDVGTRGIRETEWEAYVGGLERIERLAERVS